MSEANKTALRRIYDEVFSQGRFEVVEEVVSADAVDHTPPPGGSGNTPEDLKAFTLLVRQAFPDAVFRSVVELADGDKVAMHWEMTGTHQGDFLGAAPTGQRVTLRGIDMVTVVDGKCTEHWGFDDTWRLLAGGGPPPS